MNPITLLIMNLIFLLIILTIILILSLLKATLWCLDPGMLLMDEQWELILWDTLINTLDHLDHQASMLISMIRNSLLTSAGMCGYRVFSWLLSVVRNICR